MSVPGLTPICVKKTPRCVMARSFKRYFAKQRVCSFTPHPANDPSEIRSREADTLANNISTNINTDT